MTLEAVKKTITTRDTTAAPTLKEQLDALGTEIARALPGSIDPQRFARSTLTVLRQTPALASCSWPSIAGALMTAAQVGLEPGPLGHCWLIPRGREATFQLGYTGLVELARRSGLVGSIRTGVIYDWAELDERDGTDPHLIIRPIRPRPDDAAPLAFWCVVERIDGASDHWSVMEVAEIEAAKAKIPGSNRAGSAWREHFDAMARITVFRRMRGMLPLSVELATALELDGQVINRTDTVDAFVEPATRALPARVSMLDGGPTPDGEPFGLDESDQEIPGATPGAVPAHHDEPMGVLVVGETEQEEEAATGGAVPDHQPDELSDGPAAPPAKPRRTR